MADNTQALVSSSSSSSQASAFTYPNVQQIQKQLKHLSKGNESVDDYMHCAKSLFDQLATLHCPMPEDMLVNDILDGLGLDFRPFSRAIEASFKSSSNPSNSNRCLGYGRGGHGRGCFSNTFSQHFSISPTTVCYNCNGNGHLARQCPTPKKSSTPHTSSNRPKPMSNFATSSNDPPQQWTINSGANFHMTIDRGYPHEMGTVSSKTHKLPFVDSHSPVSRPLELICFDVWGPSPIASSREVEPNSTSIMPWVPAPLPPPNISPDTNHVNLSNPSQPSLIGLPPIPSMHVSHGHHMTLILSQSPNTLTTLTSPLVLIQSNKQHVSNSTTPSHLNKQHLSIPHPSIPSSPPSLSTTTHPTSAPPPSSLSPNTTSTLDPMSSSPTLITQRSHLLSPSTEDSLLIVVDSSSC
ncbi:uncharacterized protein LOC131180081 [Hevea brasiliensis]|uniref:uncharacterized protein LOC131180081 n=1 Tax=Hevea brasiliensis TaxID=3981 RepID=UPI0025CFFEDD|nr:uncharacterized protein LOC131180081 [Hevea brasiliensis]